MWWASIAIALAGCSSILGIQPVTVGDGGGSGTIADAYQTQTIDGSLCEGSGAFEVCLTALPSAPVVVQGSIDTDASSYCFDGYTLPAEHPWCVVIGTTLAVHSVTAQGSRPLVLLATQDLTIANGDLLDASSHQGVAGPAANNPACSTSSAGNAGVLDDGGGAGAGGSFGTMGGGGAAGGDSAATPGSVGGAIAMPSGLFGGCPGGLGGEGNDPQTDECNPNMSDPPGAGGGAVYLLAGGTVRIDGTVAAGGAGGGGGKLARGGGSGGGSGGLIVIWAGSSIMGNGQLVTTGGGGGGGADHCGNASFGVDGSLGGAAGPGADSDCPNGGSGAAGMAAGQPGLAGGTKGASAGGGGVGFVMIHGGSFAGAISGITLPI